MPKDRTCVLAQSQHGGSLHSLDSLFTHLNWVLEAKDGNESFKNLISVLQYANWKVHMP